MNQHQASSKDYIVPLFQYHEPLTLISLGRPVFTWEQAYPLQRTKSSPMWTSEL